MFSSRIFTCFVLVTITLSVNQINANDTQNLNRLLNNQVIVSRQIMCVLEKSPCDQLGRQLKGKDERCACDVLLKEFLVYMNELKSRAGHSMNFVLCIGMKDDVFCENSPYCCFIVDLMFKHS